MTVWAPNIPENVCFKLTVSYSSLSSFCKLQKKKWVNKCCLIGVFARISLFCVTSTYSTPRYLTQYDLNYLTFLQVVEVQFCKNTPCLHHCRYHLSCHIRCCHHHHHHHQHHCHLSHLQTPPLPHCQWSKKPGTQRYLLELFSPPWICLHVQLLSKGKNNTLLSLFWLALQVERVYFLLIVYFLTIMLYYP